MPKKKVLFLYHGGTIGQVPTIKFGQKVLAPPKDAKTFQDACDPIIKNFSKEIKIKFEVTTTKDSVNMTPKDWEKLIFRVKQAQEEGYDAVAIAHGTDTLAYTSTALSFGLHGPKPKGSGLKIPVCITGAQNPIYEEGGDGKFNLENLFRTISSAMNNGVSDVLVNFWNRVLLGSRTIKVSERSFDAMQSPAYPDVGVIDAKGVEIDTKIVRLAKNAAKKFNISPKFGRGVVAFELSPGMEPSLILGFITGGGLSAMILKSLGEGSVCTEGEYDLRPVIKQATEEYKTPIFITSKFVGGSTGAMHYDVSYQAVKAGGIACYDHTDIAVDVKVRWLIGNGIFYNIDDFRRAMKTNYSGEVTPQR